MSITRLQKMVSGDSTLVHQIRFEEILYRYEDVNQGFSSPINLLIPAPYNPLLPKQEGGEEGG